MSDAEEAILLPRRRKVKLKVKVAQLCPTLCNPIVWNSPGQNIGVCSLSPLPGIFWTLGSNPGLPHHRHIFFTSWATRKPKNTGVESPSLLQGIFPTQELNQRLLHCRWILYQLSYEGSPPKRKPAQIKPQRRTDPGEFQRLGGRTD